MYDAHIATGTGGVDIDIGTGVVHCRDSHSTEEMY
jgi:hypothetical protein